MSPADDRRPSSVLVGALMAEPPLIPDRWNALLVGAVIFGFSWRRLGRASAEMMREERAALGGGVAKLSALNPNHPW